MEIPIVPNITLRNILNILQNLRNDAFFFHAKRNALYPLLKLNAFNFRQIATPHHSVCFQDRKKKHCSTFYSNINYFLSFFQSSEYL